MKNRKFLFSCIIAALLYLISFESYSRTDGLQNPKSRVCEDEVVTYIYVGGLVGCGLTWKISQGIFIDDSDVTYVSKWTNADRASAIRVKWTGGSGAYIRVDGGCGTDMIDITIEEISLSISANQTSVNLGDQVTLTASATPSNNTYSWSATTNGNLNSTTGNPVTASPINQSNTYTAKATHVFSVNDVEITCTQEATKIIAVTLPPISGNSICCNQCVPSGLAPTSLGQSPGTILSGGNGTPFGYQWQQSANSGASYSDISGANGVSYSPPSLGQKMLYRRLVTGGGFPARYSSNVVTIDVLDLPSSPTIGTTSYSSSQQKKAFGTITIQGDQTPATGVIVNFIAEQQIVVLPSSWLKPGLTLSVGALCDPPTGGRMESVGEMEIIEVDTITESSLYPLAIIQDTTGLPDSLSKKNESRFSVSPNPANATITIRYRTQVRGFVKLSVIDNNGKIIYNVMNSNVETGEHEQNLDVSQWSHGLYILKLNTYSYNESLKLIKN
jgi:hypothetical protein